MSDHNHITLELAHVKMEVQFGRNSKKTDWQVSRILLRLSTTHGIENYADSLSECIVSSYENNCRLRMKGARDGPIRLVSGDLTEDAPAVL